MGIDEWQEALLEQGYRLVCIVEDDVLIVLALAAGKRESGAAYAVAAKRRK